MTDQQIQRDVTDELSWDPKVDSGEIAVAVDNGAVTLRGTVGSFQAKRDAAADARVVGGVTDVLNELEVRLLDEAQRKDADLRAAVLQALTLDSLVPSTVEADVTDGWVTLSGSASWQYQRDEAESVAGNVGGVAGLSNYIDLVASMPLAPDVKQSISNALQRNARIDAHGIIVDTADGTVTLHGTVSSFADRDQAVAAAWAAPGVTNVTDDIEVSY